MAWPGEAGSWLSESVVLCAPDALCRCTRGERGVGIAVVFWLLRTFYACFCFLFAVARCGFTASCLISSCILPTSSALKVAIKSRCLSPTLPLSPSFSCSLIAVVLVRARSAFSSCRRLALFLYYQRERAAAAAEAALLLLRNCFKLCLTTPYTPPRSLLSYSTSTTRKTLRLLFIPFLTIAWKGI